ncbi:MAG: hypothetical protein RL701_7529 [Pseudomonadota bacterium]
MSQAAVQTRSTVIFLRKLTAVYTAGNLVFDAQIAAICVRQGAQLLTHDRDFARFGVQTLSL